MTTKTSTKTESFEERAARVAAEAAEIQAEQQRRAEEAWQRQQEAQEAADRAVVDAFDAAALDAAIRDAHAAIDAAVAEMPVTKAVSNLLVAHWRRNYARLDVTQARARLGLPELTFQPPNKELPDPLPKLIEESATRQASQIIDDERRDTF
jgi:hypothetical protein